MFNKCTELVSPRRITHTCWPAAHTLTAETQAGQTQAMGTGETHRLVGLRQNMELYGTMGLGPLLSTSSASASFLPSAWPSRSTLPPTGTQGLKIRGCTHINP